MLSPVVVTLGASDSIYVPSTSGSQPCANPRHWQLRVSTIDLKDITPSIILLRAQRDGAFVLYFETFTTVGSRSCTEIASKESWPRRTCLPVTSSY